MKDIPTAFSSLGGLSAHKRKKKTKVDDRPVNGRNIVIK